MSDQRIYCEHCQKDITPKQRSTYTPRFCSRECHGQSKRIQISNGARFGRLTVVSPAGKDAHGHFIYACRCDCGNAVSVAKRHLYTSNTASCGCLRQEEQVKRATLHGYCAFAEYENYRNAIKRCTMPTARSYPRYGGRGIEFRFRDFSHFYSVLGPRPTSNHSIDRIDNDGHYEPGNVRWATRSEQEHNKTIPRGAK